jgi:hypothetical protein
MKIRRTASQNKKPFRVDTIGGGNWCQTSEIRGLVARAFDLPSLIFYTE